ncbi:hypothetical protein KR059_006091, partial [Drosophila kikkawai]
MSTAAWIITFALLIFHQGSAQLLDSDCGITSAPIDGESPSPSPWLALIRSNNQNCSGVLIDQQYVITAASCIINSTQTLVRLGDSDGSHRYEEYYAVAAIVHYLFHESEYLSDLALLKLQSKVTYKPHIRPICVLLNSEKKAEVDEFKDFYITHWGLNEFRFFPSPRTNTISRLNGNQCLDVYNSAPESSQICAQFNSGASCLEHGSPLSGMINYKDTQRTTLYGIQSYGTTRTCMFTDIMSHVDWIAEHVFEAYIIKL